MHMPRITVYVPDDLKARMDDASDNLNWSAVAQRAFGEAIATHELKKDSADMTAVTERLRASKERAEEANFDRGKEHGATWARTEAEYEELQRVWGAINDGGEFDLADLQRLIDPEGEMDRSDWQEFWKERGALRPTDDFAHGFAEGAFHVFQEVQDEL
jgi:hypothetical protein